MKISEIKINNLFGLFNYNLDLKDNKLIVDLKQQKDKIQARPSRYPG